MKTIISPSILGGSFSNMESIVKQLDRSNADYIHFDVMDGDKMKENNRKILQKEILKTYLNFIITILENIKESKDWT